jgi:hypothetical protein
MTTTSIVIPARPVQLQVGHSVPLSETHSVTRTESKRYEAAYLNLAGNLISKPATNLTDAYALADECHAGILVLREKLNASKEATHYV